MNTTFEKELRKLFGQDAVLYNTKYVGRNCYGSLDDDLKVRSEFITTHISNHFDALKISVINRTDGVVDTALLRLDELWGIKKGGRQNPYAEISPHLWKDGSNLVWYGYQPTPADFEILSDRINDYLDVFRDLEQTEEWAQTM